VRRHYLQAAAKRHQDKNRRKSISHSLLLLQESRGMSPSTSTLWGVPLTLMVKDMASSEVLSQDQDRIAPLRCVLP